MVESIGASRVPGSCPDRYSMSPTRIAAESVAEFPVVDTTVRDWAWAELASKTAAAMLKASLRIVSWWDGWVTQFYPPMPVSHYPTGSPSGVQLARRWSAAIFRVAPTTPFC